MAALQWTEDMSVGINVLDLDHRQIISIINLLNDSVAEGDGKMCAMLMNSLVQEASAHFRREEVILRRYGFPGLDAHVADHAEMVEILEEFSRILGAGRYDEARHIIDQVQDLFANRLLPEDMRYRAFLEDQGVVAPRPAGTRPAA